MIPKRWRRPWEVAVMEQGEPHRHSLHWRYDTAVQKSVKLNRSMREDLRPHLVFFARQRFPGRAVTS